MMHRAVIFLAVILAGVFVRLHAQERVHSHNDYAHQTPFWDAYHAHVSSIEADVFPVRGKLMVAHAKNAITAGRTLDSLYLEPIVRLFQANGNKTVSADTAYTFYLMIDIKERWDRVLPVLIRRLERYPACFDRTVNPMAVQVFISGDRPADTTFHQYPPVILFDGLPGVHYAAADLKKIVMISTDFSLYSHWEGKGAIPPGDAAKLHAVIQKAHHLKPRGGLPVRFWGAPDTPDCWATLRRLGADVINTDQVDVVSAFLHNH